MSKRPRRMENAMSISTVGSQSSSILISNSSSQSLNPKPQGSEGATLAQHLGVFMGLRSKSCDVGLQLSVEYPKSELPRPKLKRRSTSTGFSSSEEFSSNDTPTSADVIVGQSSYLERKFESRWEILAELGAGSFGKVYHVKHRKRGEEAAAKSTNFFTREGKLNISGIRSAIYERNAVRKLKDHLHVVNFIDYFDENNIERFFWLDKNRTIEREEKDILDLIKKEGVVFHEHDKIVMVMEYLRGDNVIDRLEDLKHYTEDIAHRFLLQLLKSVKTCHDRNIMHRDIKLENLMLKSKGDHANVSMCDFGSCYMFKNGEQDCTNGQDVAATRAYRAPEIIDEFGPHGKPVDMWSVGVVAYILLFGQYPFGCIDGRASSSEQEDQYAQLNNKIRSVYYDLNHASLSRYKVSDDAKDLINKLLVKDPSKRLTADQALSHVWMKTGSSELEQRNLDESLEAFKKNVFCPKKTLRKTINAVIGINKFKKVCASFLGNVRTTLSECDDDSNIGDAFASLASASFEKHFATKSTTK